jgi:thiol peroxidase
MVERDGEVTMKGNPVTLEGNTVQVGQPAADAVLVANDLSEFKLSSLKGKNVLISVVPSLDTPVCDQQTKHFNAEAGRLGDTVKIITISMDLPFAQKRWCGATSSSKLQTLSDHRNAEFGRAYGLLVKGVRLLARAIIIIDAKGIIRYKQVVPEITTEPNYAEALDALKKV